MTKYPFQLVEWHPATITDTYHLARDTTRAFLRVVEGLPRNFQNQLAKGFAEKYNEYNKPEHTDRKLKKGQRKITGASVAFKYLKERTERAKKILKSYPLPVRALYRESDLETIAKHIADECYGLLSEGFNGEYDYTKKLCIRYSEIVRHTKKYKIEPPQIAVDIPESIEVALMRLTCSKWWTRKLGAQARQVRELIQVAAKRVNAKCPYVSYDGLKEYRTKQRAMENFLNSFELICEETEQKILLADMYAKSSATPENRRNELMIRLRGLEEVANEQGKAAYFITWTAPSKYHGSSHKWGGQSPKKVQAYLCGQWAKARAKLGRNGIEFSGARVTEPHKDACPHWHMLVFVDESQALELVNILRSYATEHEKQEIENNVKARFDVKKIDPSEGSAVGYIAKYIAKNIDAEGVKNAKDLETEKGNEKTLGETCERVRAWASLWNVRQFQFFGAAKVSVWRELRRLKNPTLTGQLAEIHAAADGAEWAKFQTLCEGQSIGLEYETEDGAGEYGDPIDRVVGVAMAGVVTLTRLLSWVKQKVGTCANESGEAVKGGCPSWTRVSNCTQQAEQVQTTGQNLGQSMSSVDKPLKTESGRFFWGVSEGQKLRWEEIPEQLFKTLSNYQSKWG